MYKLLFYIHSSISNGNGVSCTSSIHVETFSTREEADIAYALGKHSGAGPANSWYLFCKKLYLDLPKVEK